MLPGLNLVLKQKHSQVEHQTMSLEVAKAMQAGSGKCDIRVGQERSADNEECWQSRPGLDQDGVG